MPNNLGPPVGIPEIEDWLPMPPDQGPPPSEVVGYNLAVGGSTRC